MRVPQLPLTGGAAPLPRAVLERHNAELEAELLHMHTNCGQLKARLDASQALCNELQRALVDAHTPQVSLASHLNCMGSSSLLLTIPVSFWIAVCLLPPWRLAAETTCMLARSAPPVIPKALSAALAWRVFLQGFEGRMGMQFLYLQPLQDRAAGRSRADRSPSLPAIAEHLGAAAAVPASPASPFPTADVARHLANTTNQVGGSGARCHGALCRHALFKRRYRNIETRQPEAVQWQEHELSPIRESSAIAQHPYLQ